MRSSRQLQMPSQYLNMKLLKGGGPLFSKIRLSDGTLDTLICRSVHSPTMSEHEDNIRESDLRGNRTLIRYRHVNLPTVVVQAAMLIQPEIVRE